MSMSGIFETGDVKSLTCPRHGGYEGKPFRIAGAEWSDPRCPGCAAEQRTAEQADAVIEKRRQEAARQIRRLVIAGIPARFRGLGFDHYRIGSGRDGETRRRVVTALRDWVAGFDAAAKVGRGVVLVGFPGTGKTHLACAAVQGLLANGTDAYYADAWTMLDRIKSSYRPGAARDEDKVIAEDFVRPALLVIDDVGAQRGTETERALLHRVIDLRYQSVKPTVVVSNLEIEPAGGGHGLTDAIGSRAVSRLRDAGGLILQCGWADYRRGGK